MGSAFAFPCLDNNHDISIVGTHLEDDFISQMFDNKKFHPGLNISIPEGINLFKFKDFENILKSKVDLIVLGISSKGIEWVSEQLHKVYKDIKLPKLLMLTKGLAVINDKFETLAEKLNNILNNQGVSNAKISAVGGPCLANGLANRINSSVVLANENIDVVKKIGSMISTEYYSTEYSVDLIGVEVCAATKNIYSMLVGASEGLSSNNLSNEIKKKYFLNTAASLVYKAVSEMKNLSKKLHGNEETAYGLAGLGDLHVSSAGGRNSKMGYYLGQGYKFTDAKAKFMKEITVEGADLAFAIGPKILKEFKKEEFPLLISVIETICENKKLEINW